MCSPIDEKLSELDYATLKDVAEEVGGNDLLDKTIFCITDSRTGLPSALGYIIAVGSLEINYPGITEYIAGRRKEAAAANTVQAP